MNESRIVSMTWGAWSGTKWSIRARCLAHLGSGRVLCWGDSLDQVFCDMRVVGLGCSETQVSFGYPSITLHVPQFQILSHTPVFPERAFGRESSKRWFLSCFVQLGKTFREGIGSGHMLCILTLRPHLLCFTFSSSFSSISDYQQLVPC